MPFYITNKNETFLSIAQRFNFGFVWSLGETLRKLNPQAKFESKSFFNANLLPYQAIIIPERFPIEIRVPNPKELHTLKQINMMALEARKKLSILLEQGIDINTLRAIYDATHIREIKEYLPDSVRALANASVNVTSKRAEKFLRAVKSMNEKLEGYLKTAKGPLRQSYVEEVLKPAYKEMMQSYRGYAVLKYKSKAPFAPLKQIKASAWNVGAFKLNELSEVISIEKTLKSLKFISKGLFILDIGMGLTNVYEAYLDNKDWMEALAGEIGSFAGGMMGVAAGEFGALYVLGTSFLMLTPVGWCVVVASSALAGYLGSKLLKSVAIETFRNYEKNQMNEIQQSINNSLSPFTSIDEALGMV